MVITAAAGKMQRCHI